MKHESQGGDAVSDPLPRHAAAFRLLTTTDTSHPRTWSSAII
jgi:hypothetical protein